MSDAFDPYHKWLAIPPEEQPPNHYRLLAIELFEEDEEVIANAAEQRIAHLRIMEMGEEAATATALIAEVTQARDCLLDPQQRKSYQEQISAEQVTEPVAKVTAPLTEGKGGREKEKKASKKAKKISLIGHIVAPIVGLAIGGLVLWTINAIRKAEKDPDKIEFPDWVDQEEQPSQEDNLPPVKSPPEAAEKNSDPQHVEKVDSADAADTPGDAIDTQQPLNASAIEQESPPPESAFAASEPEPTKLGQDSGEPLPLTEQQQLPEEPVVDVSAEKENRLAEKEAALQVAVDAGTLVRQIELAQEVADLGGQAAWDRQLEFLESYQRADAAKDDRVIVEAALLLADRAARDGRVEQARSLAADALRAARRNENPRLERLVTVRVLQLPPRESE